MIRLISILLLTVFGLGVNAATYSVDEVPNPILADKTHFVSNPDGILDASTVSQLNSALSNVRKKLTVEMAVVVVDNIDTDENTFATELFQKWGIGKGDNDNGILVLVVKDLRRAVIRTGYGVEGVLPDISAGRIIRNDMAPYFKKGDYDSGTLSAVAHIIEALDNPDVAAELRSEQADDIYAHDPDNDISWGGILSMYIGFCVILTLGCGIVVLGKYSAVKSRSANEKYTALAPMQPISKALCWLGLGLPLMVYLPLKERFTNGATRPESAPTATIR